MSIDLAAIGDDEYSADHASCVARARAAGSDVLAMLAAEAERTAALLAGIPETRAGLRYAPGKWSIRELIGHLADTERIMAYRALRIARADPTPLPGFDEKAYAAASGADARALADLAAELGAVRAATLALFAHLDAGALARRGTANDQTVSVRALAAVIAGHELHHRAILEERYQSSGG
ncbi:MAG TPA: DinB family protein [Thermoanaerobaculia bacterium]|nr:DinB family protein [Thermoanaerobaculia bacterium]